ncbi:hypothetical protein CPB84DRAFT_1747077 [Gymnopilus junonius]|uniref:Uncharacterized protein n=1 Tax=Gymnopilus junonius TaxID=109634 RepID=A0A9P5NLD2_GYMJU|nr:hypothetical protein CPB84DRAFT_1747077 [Gymnopilus junonius]
MQVDTFEKNWLGSWTVAIYTSCVAVIISITIEPMTLSSYQGTIKVYVQSINHQLVATTVTLSDYRHHHHRGAQARGYGAQRRRLWTISRLIPLLIEAFPSSYHILPKFPQCYRLSLFLPRRAIGHGPSKKKSVVYHPLAHTLRLSSASAITAPPLGVSRLGVPGPLLVPHPHPHAHAIPHAHSHSYSSTSQSDARHGHRRDTNTNTTPPTPRHRLGVACLALDTSTQLVGNASPEGILYTGGRDGMVMSWDLGIPMKKRELGRRSSYLDGNGNVGGHREEEEEEEEDEGVDGPGGSNNPRTRARARRRTSGRWEILTGWDDAGDSDGGDGGGEDGGDERHGAGGGRGHGHGHQIEADERKECGRGAGAGANGNGDAGNRAGGGGDREEDGVPYERRWETDLGAFQPGTRTRFRQCSQAHTDWVNDILLCNYNQTLVSASSDGTVKAWNPHAALPSDPVKIGKHADYVRCLAYCREQHWIVSGSFDRTIKLWDLSRSSSSSSSSSSCPSPSSSDLSPLITLHPPDPSSGLSGTSGPSKPSVLSKPSKPSGPSASGTSGTARPSGPSGPSGSPKSSVYALAADPFGRTIASGGPERVVRLWDLRSGRRVAKLVGHTDNIRAILVSEDSRYLLTGSADASIKLWSLRTQKCLHTFTHHTDSVWSLFSSHPSLEVFYSGDRAGLVCRVDVEGVGDLGGFGVSGYEERGYRATADYGSGFGAGGYAGDVGEGECVVLCNDSVSASASGLGGAGEEVGAPRGGGGGGGGGKGVNKLVVMDDNLLWAASGTSSVRRWRIPQRRSARVAGVYAAAAASSSAQAGAPQVPSSSAASAQSPSATSAASAQAVLGSQTAAVSQVQAPAQAQQATVQTEGLTDIASDNVERLSSATEFRRKQGPLPEAGSSSSRPSTGNGHGGGGIGSHSHSHSHSNSLSHTYGHSHTRSQSRSRRMSASPSLHSLASEINRFGPDYSLAQGQVQAPNTNGYGNGTGTGLAIANEEGIAGIPYASLVRLVSPNEPFGGGGGGGAFGSSVSYYGGYGAYGSASSTYGSAGYGGHTGYTGYTGYAGYSGGGGGRGRDGDPEVATLYSAASVMSVPRHPGGGGGAQGGRPAVHHIFPRSSSPPPLGSPPGMLNNSRTEETVMLSAPPTVALYESRDLASEATPFCSAPDEVIEGSAGLVRSVILNDRMHVLTVDTSGKVGVGGVDHQVTPQVQVDGEPSPAIAIDAEKRQRERSPREALEAVRERIEGEGVASTWCYADTKAGVLTIHLNERCFEAEVYADEVGFEGDGRFNDESKRTCSSDLSSKNYEYTNQRVDISLILILAIPSLVHHHHIPPTNLCFYDTRRDTYLFRPVKASPLLAPLIPLHVLSKEVLPVIPQSPSPNTTLGVTSDVTPTPGTAGARGRYCGWVDDGDLAAHYFFWWCDDTWYAGGGGKEDYFSPQQGQQHQQASLPPPTPQTPSTPGGGLMSRLKNFGKITKQRPVSDVPNVSTLTTPAAETPTPQTSNVVQVEPTPVQKVLLSETLTPPSSMDAPLHGLPPNTTVLIAEEAQPSFNVLYRRNVERVGEDVQMLEETMPLWLAEYLLLNRTPPVVPLAKLSFVLMPWNKDPDVEPLPELLNTQQSKLTASRFLRVKKIVGHVQDKLERMAHTAGTRSGTNSIRSSVDGHGQNPHHHEHPRPRAEDEYEILCNDVVLPLGMSLAAVRQYVWRQGAELVMHYRRKRTSGLSSRPHAFN